MVTALPPAPGELDPRHAALLRRAASASGFNQHVLPVLGPIGVPGWKAAAGANLKRLPTPACALLTRFFILGESIAGDVLAPALGGPDVPDALGRARLAERNPDGSWRCLFVLAPDAEAPAFSDPIDDPGALDPPDDYVLPVGGTTRYVDQLTVREPCALAVDIGCGQGFLALHAATHARRVLGTDISQRALAFTRANAFLNGAQERIETRAGSLYEPLGDLSGQVDLLTCNPPFLIQPGRHSKTTVSSMEGDGMLEHLARGAPALLRERGWATMIGIWEHPDLADPLARLRPWLDGAGCDAVILRFKTYRPHEYFEHWVAPELREAAEPQWNEACERRRIGGLTYGALVLHRRTGVNWMCALFTAISMQSGSASTQLRALFRTQTALRATVPAALLNRRLRAAPGWRFDPVGPPPRVPPPGASPGLVLALPGAAGLDPLLRAFERPVTGRQALTRVHRAGLGIAPEHPGAVGLLHGLVSAGCLDIVD